MKRKANQNKGKRRLCVKRTIERKQRKKRGTHSETGRQRY